MWNSWQTKNGRFWVGITMAALSAGLAAQSLKETGDAGRVADVQGVASVRAKGGNRWSLAAPGFALKPGDWVRTDVRGANALRLRLAGGGEATLGPGTLVEVADAASLELVGGEIEVAAQPGRERGLTVKAADAKPHEVRDGARKVLRRAEGKGIDVLETDPNWLQGFKGAVTTESMGSLLAKVDGRNTPLTLGYHKVTVDIRDQVARTVVEESFVNHTDGPAPGVESGVTFVWRLRAECPGHVARASCPPPVTAKLVGRFKSSNCGGEVVPPLRWNQSGAPSGPTGCRSAP